jgi:hypothetical protein
MARPNFTSKNFLIRWAVALVLVLGTFNPTEFSYFHWVSDMLAENAPLKVLAGIAILIFYVIYLRATWRSIGPIGLVLAAAFFGAVIWALAYYGLLDPSQTTVMTYVILILLATIMAIGISWSHVRRRVSGQLDTDEVDE